MCDKHYPKQKRSPFFLLVAAVLIVAERRQNFENIILGSLHQSEDDKSVAICYWLRAEAP